MSKWTVTDWLIILGMIAIGLLFIVGNADAGGIGPDLKEVPEADTLSMLAAGMLMGWFAHRRKKRKGG